MRWFDVRVATFAYKVMTVSSRGRGTDYRGRTGACPVSRRLRDGSGMKDGGQLPREPRYSKEGRKLGGRELVVSIRVNLTLTTSHFTIALLLVLVTSQSGKYL